MTTLARSILGLLLAGPVCGLAAGQDTGDSAIGPQEETASFDEEVVVRGRSRAALRLQIQIAEEAVYARFNDINSNDEFDIHCYQEVITGSKIPRRVCQPNLWRTALRRAGVEAARAMQGSYALNGAQFQAEAMYKRSLMVDELQRLAREDEELQRAVVNLARLTGAASEQRGRVRLPASAADRVATADEEVLPYGAAVMANVWVRREPWTHALTHRIFTIANLYGQIESIDLDCGDQSERIEYEPGAEWSLPDGWESCEVTVAANPGTTFALYEFE